MILDEICEHKREEVKASKAATPLSELEDQLERVKPARDFRQALKKEGLSLIAEVKRASPSKGVMLRDTDPLTMAALYERSGADAISILTDERFFQGTLDDLVTVRRSVDVPCLRKEFIIDAYQIYEARAATADAILLIVRILSDDQLKEYRELAEGFGMGVLVETHDAGEVERAIESGASIIGVNNRDLATFEVDFRTTLELRKIVPGGKVLVSESGIHTRDHVRALEDGGVDAILVGEALVTSENISAKIAEMMGRDEG